MYFLHIQLFTVLFALLSMHALVVYKITFDIYRLVIMPMICIEYLISFVSPGDNQENLLHGSNHIQPGIQLGIRFGMKLIFFTISYVPWLGWILHLALPDILKSNLIIFVSNGVLVLYRRYLISRIPENIADGSIIIQISSKPIPNMSSIEREQKYPNYGLCRFPTTVFNTTMFPIIGNSEVCHVRLAVNVSNSQTQTMTIDKIDAFDNLAAEKGKIAMIFPELFPGWVYPRVQKEKIKIALEKETNLPIVLIVEIIKLL